MSRNTILLILPFFILLSAQALDQVAPQDFDGSFWFLQVYSGSCPDCKNQQTEVEHVGSLMKGVAKVGKLNSESIGGLKLKKNPSYFLLRGELSDYVQYKEKLSKVAISKFIFSEMEKKVKERYSKLFGGSQPKEPKKPKPSNKPSGNKKENGVIVLTDGDFESSVRAGEQAWFVEFYSPSCGHCHALQPEFDKLPAKIGKRVNIAKIDATQNRQMAQKFQIKGFPTLLFFAPGEETPVPYQGERTSDAMVSWLQTQKIGEEKLQFLKLTKEAYNKECNRNIVCLVYIIDKKSQVKDDLSFIEDVMEEHKGKPLRFFYSPRVPTLESALMIEDRSTPKLVSIWDSINSYKIYNKEHSEGELNAYIGKIMERRTWIKVDGKIAELLFSSAQEEL